MRRTLLLASVALLVAAPVAAQIPRAALTYHRSLVGSVRMVWGLSAPIAVFAGQVHQESGWRTDARSKYASGLAQFTPATADWISTAYRNELGDNQPLEPGWALRALARYDKHLYDRVASAADECARFSFVLSGYNGGEGWRRRDQALTATRGGDPTRWFGHVERHSARAGWAIAENRDYVRKILLRWQFVYQPWGAIVPCEGVS